MDQPNEEELARRQFVAVLSHELRTPLNVILLNVQMLEVSGEIAAGEELQCIRCHAWQLSGVINRLLRMLDGGPLAGEPMQWQVAASALVCEQPRIDAEKRVGYRHVK